VTTHQQSVRAWYQQSELLWPHAAYIPRQTLHYVRHMGKYPMVLRRPLAQWHNCGTTLALLHFPPGHQNYQKPRQPHFQAHCFEEFGFPAEESVDAYGQPSEALAAVPDPYDKYRSSPSLDSQYGFGYEAPVRGRYYEAEPMDIDPAPRIAPRDIRGRFAGAPFPTGPQDRTGGINAPRPDLLVDPLVQLPQELQPQAEVSGELLTTRLLSLHHLGQEPQGLKRAPQTRGGMAPQPQYGTHHTGPLEATAALLLKL